MKTYSNNIYFTKTFLLQDLHTLRNEGRGKSARDVKVMWESGMVENILELETEDDLSF